MDPSSFFVLDTYGSQSLNEKPFIIYDVNSKDSNGGNTGGSISAPSNWVNRRSSALKRYHTIDKFSDFKPGVLSANLREALSIEDNEIPLYVYKMRSLGYPPGWLRKAKLEELSMFNDSTESLTPKVTYKESEIIRYPGFNVSVERRHNSRVTRNCPPIQMAHLIDNFINSLKNGVESHSVHLSKLHGDIKQLEIERQRLLDEIKQFDKKGNTEPSGTLKLDCTDTEFDISSKVHETHTVVTESSPSELSFNIKSELPPPPVAVVTTNEGASLSPKWFDGTPTPTCLTALEVSTDVLITPSSPNKRPDLDAFRRGIQPYQPFVNLPDTQGSYVLVRDTLKRAKNRVQHSSDLLSVEKMDSHTDKRKSPLQNVCVYQPKRPNHDYSLPGVNEFNVGSRNCPLSSRLSSNLYNQTVRK